MKNVLDDSSRYMHCCAGVAIANDIIIEVLLAILPSGVMMGWRVYIMCWV